MNVLHYRDGSTERLESEPAIDEGREVIVIEGVGSREVPFSNLKAVFGLRDETATDSAPLSGATPGGVFIVVEFFDGEVIRGRARYNPASPGFSLYPAEKGKNERVFVIASAVQSIEVDKV